MRSAKTPAAHGDTLGHVHGGRVGLAMPNAEITGSSEGVHFQAIELLSKSLSTRITRAEWGREPHFVTLLICGEAPCWRVWYKLCVQRPTLHQELARVRTKVKGQVSYAAVLDPRLTEL